MKKNISRGFSIMEIIIVLTIFALLLALGANSLLNMRDARKLETITDGIAAKLEEARTNSMSGKNGEAHGIAFTPTSYTYWYGLVYNPSDPTNVVYEIDGNFILDTTLSGDYVKFARITGVPNTAGTTTITSKGRESTTDSIYIGAYGDINVIK